MLNFKWISLKDHENYEDGFEIAQKFLEDIVNSSMINEPL